MRAWAISYCTSTTAIGLDVHARSIKAFALNPMSGECERASFGYDPAAIAEWALSFEEPRAVYESGVTGFHLCRTLRALGLDCVVGAVSKMQRPAADRGRKTDRRDAEFLARLLATRNVVEVWVPDESTEAARDLSRALADARDDLQRAKQRMSKFLLRHGHVFDETTPTGARKGNWTRAYWRWADAIEFAEADDAAAYEHYRDCVRRCQEARDALARRVAESAGRPGWKPAVDALRCVKGVDVATRLPARLRGRRLLEVPHGARVRVVVRPHALGALERRDVVEGRDHARGQRPRALGARRGGLARTDVVAGG